jgi:hydroxylaminobenzene mutase
LKTQELNGRVTLHFRPGQVFKLRSIRLKEKRNEMEFTNRRLMWHGMFLFLIGLLTGFAEQHFANERMGLAAHLEGVMNGTFLVALGAIWNEVRLSSLSRALAHWVALCGTYGNWLVTTLAAIFGTAALSPITGAGHSGLPCQETLVTVGFMIVAVTIIATAIFVLWGLRTRAAN